jgi:hypothetical protein
MRQLPDRARYSGTDGNERQTRALAYKQGVGGSTPVLSTVSGTGHFQGIKDNDYVHYAASAGEWELGQKALKRVRGTGPRQDSESCEALGLDGVLPVAASDLTTRTTEGRHVWLDWSLL